MPFVALTGPLAVDLSAERETRAPRAVLVLQAGYLQGAPLDPGAVATAGSLRLRFDGEHELEIAVPAVEVGPALAATLEGALRAAPASPVAPAVAPDAARLAELARVTVRWEATTRRLYVVSGRYGAVAAPEVSRVELVGGAAAASLGLTTGRAVSGRAVRHQVAAPRAMNVEVRLDLWAASQIDLGGMIDSLLRALPARGHVPTRGALLGGDLPLGATQLVVLGAAWPTLKLALAHLEPAGEQRCRVSGAAVELAGAAWNQAGRSLDLPADAAATLAVAAAPLLPDPLAPPQLTPRGFAVGLGVRLSAPLAVGESRPLVRLDRVVDGVARTPLVVTLVGLGAGDNGLEIQAAAELDGAGGFASATSAWRVAATALADSTDLHVVVHAGDGSVGLSLAGTPLAPQPGATVVPGAPTLGVDTTLTLGGAGPGLVQIGNVLLLDEPVGPLDPRLRSAGAPASRFAPGDQVLLARTSDGVTPGEQRFIATVQSVSGATVSFSPATNAAFPAGRTILFHDDLFVEQLRVTRKDDLLNRLFRASVDYRVAGILEDDLADTTAPLVETPVADVRAVAPPRPAPEPGPSAPAALKPSDAQGPGAAGHAVSTNESPPHVSPP